MHWPRSRRLESKAFVPWVAAGGISTQVKWDTGCHCQRLCAHALSGAPNPWRTWAHLRIDVGLTKMTFVASAQGKPTNPQRSHPHFPPLCCPVHHLHPQPTTQRWHFGGFHTGSSTFFHKNQQVFPFPPPFTPTFPHLPPLFPHFPPFPPIFLNCAGPLHNPHPQPTTQKWHFGDFHNKFPPFFHKIQQNSHGLPHFPPVFLYWPIFEMLCR